MNSYCTIDRPEVPEAVKADALKALHAIVAAANFE